MHCPLVVNLKTEWFIAVGVNLFLGSSTYVRTYIHPAINNASRLSLKTTFREWVRIAVDKAMEQPDNTHLIRKGKHHCMANLLFNWIGFSCFACVELDRDLQLWLNPNQSNRRSAIQFYFHVYKVRESPLEQPSWPSLLHAANWKQTFWKPKSFWRLNDRKMSRLKMIAKWAD